MRTGTFTIDDCNDKENAWEAISSQCAPTWWPHPPVSLWTASHQGLVSVHGAESLDRFSALPQQANHMTAHIDWRPQPNSCNQVLACLSFALTRSHEIRRRNISNSQVKLQLESCDLLPNVQDMLFSVAHYWRCFSRFWITTTFHEANTALWKLSMHHAVAHPHLFPSPPTAHPLTDLSLLHSLNHPRIH